MVLGQNVALNDLTKISVGRLAARNTVQVRGTRDAAGVLVADEVRDGSDGGGGREIRRARVTARTTSLITVLGVTVRLPANASYRRADGTRFASVAAFLEAFEASLAGGTLTLVKVLGEPLSTDLKESEIEG